MLITPFAKLKVYYFTTLRNNLFCVWSTPFLVTTAPPASMRTLVLSGHCTTCSLWGTLFFVAMAPLRPWFSVATAPPAKFVLPLPLLCSFFISHQSTVEEGSSLSVPSLVLACSKGVDKGDGKKHCQWWSV